MNFMDYIGFLGVFLLITANTVSFFSLTYREKKSFFYLNLIGSILLVPNDLFHNSYPSFAIGVFFILSSVMSLNNNNILSNKSLKILSVCFCIFWIYHFANIINTKDFQLFENTIYQLLAIISVGVSVICYGLFSARKISVLQNVVINLLAAMIIMPSLYYTDANIAQILLKIYVILVSFVALLKHKYFFIKPL